MFTLAAVGCGILLGFTTAQLAAPLYWRLLAAWPFGPGRLTRWLLALQRRLLVATGHHPYLVACVEALERAPDREAMSAARARARLWYALRRRR